MLEKVSDHLSTEKKQHLPHGSACPNSIDVLPPGGSCKVFSNGGIAM